MFWDNLSDIEKDTVVKSVKTMARELGVLGTGKIRFNKRIIKWRSHTNLKTQLTIILAQLECQIIQRQVLSTKL